MESQKDNQSQVQPTASSRKGAQGDAVDRECIHCDNRMLDIGKLEAAKDGGKS